MGRQGGSRESGLNVPGTYRRRRGESCQRRLPRGARDILSLLLVLLERFEEALTVRISVVSGLESAEDVGKIALSAL